MFRPKEIIEFLSDRSLKKKEFRKGFYSYLRSADFYGWLFNPSDEQLVDHTSITNEMYEKIATSDSVLRGIISTLEHYGTSDLGRSTATFLSSACSYGIDTVNANMARIEEKFRNKEISRRDAEEQKDIMKEFAKLIQEVVDYVNDIVRQDAKNMARETGVPKSICRKILTVTPDPEFISPAQAKVYVSDALAVIYDEMNHRETDLDDISWLKFFDGLIGKDNRNEVATVIATEGTSRIKSYNNKNVKVIWNSLTEFALDVLEKADSGIRNKMIELYIKAMRKSNKNKTDAMRVNFRSLDKKYYPRLCETVNSYKEKFDEVYSAAS